MNLLGASGALTVIAEQDRKDFANMESGRIGSPERNASNGVLSLSAFHFHQDAIMNAVAASNSLDIGRFTLQPVAYSVQVVSGKNLFVSCDISIKNENQETTSEGNKSQIILKFFVPLPIDDTQKILFKNIEKPKEL